MARLILASASPRRRDLLAGAGFSFEVEPADVDETVEPGTGPEEAAVELAERKARVVAARHVGEAAFVLGSDTIVAVDGPSGAPLLLGKAEDEDEARRMLRALSGSRHRVVTGVAVVATASGVVHTGFERTWVTMRPLSEAELSAYVASGEWRDKAGSYAIQESADAFVTGLEEGGFDNVVGLPVAKTRELLTQAGFDDLSSSPGVG